MCTIMSFKRMINQLISSSILKMGSMSIIGTFLIKGVNFLTIPIFSRIMTREEYGDINVFLTYVSIFTIILSLDFFGTIGPGLLKFKGNEREFLSVGLFFTGIYAVTIACLMNCTSLFWCELLSINKWELNILLVYSYAMYVITTKSNEYIYSFLYKENLLLNLSVALLNLGISVILIETVFRDNAYVGRVLGAALPTVIIALGMYSHLIYRGRKLWDYKYLRHYFKGGIPLIPHNLSHLILGSSDKIMIQRLVSSMENGVYSLAYTLGLMLAALIEAINNVFTPWVFRKINAGEMKDLRKIYSIYMIIFSIVAVFVAAISPEIIKILAPKQYWGGIKFILWIVYSTYLIFMYQLYVNIELYYMKTYLISIGTAAAASINIILNIIFLETYGCGFAAISTVCAYAGLLLFHLIIVNFILQCRVINNRHVVVCSLSMLLVVLILQLFLEFCFLRWLIAGVYGLILGLIVVKNYNIEFLKKYI